LALPISYFQQEFDLGAERPSKLAGLASDLADRLSLLPR
jgi:hypothetical protein